LHTFYIEPGRKVKPNHSPTPLATTGSSDLFKHEKPADCSSGEKKIAAIDQGYPRDARKPRRRRIAQHRPVSSSSKNCFS
jgi:hypothetical protein